MTTFELHVQAIERALDSVVETGTDEELFIASYLQGHVALIAKPMEIDASANLTALDAGLQASLAAAFSNHELPPTDQNKVQQLWQSILKSRQNCD